MARSKSNATIRLARRTTILGSAVMLAGVAAATCKDVVAASIGIYFPTVDPNGVPVAGSACYGACTLGPNSCVTGVTFQSCTTQNFRTVCQTGTVRINPDQTVACDLSTNLQTVTVSRFVGVGTCPPGGGPY